MKDYLSCKDIYSMIIAGCIFKVEMDFQQAHRYGTKFIVSISPGDVIPRVKVCGIVTVGKFWDEKMAQLFADKLNEDIKKEIQSESDNTDT